MERNERELLLPITFAMSAPPIATRVTIQGQAGGCCRHLLTPATVGQQKTWDGPCASALRCPGEEIAMSNAPDPVPPPGKPKIGVVWIVVVVILGLLMAAWIYSSADPRRDAPDNSDRPALGRERRMLEKIPRGVGHALREVRAGFEKIASEAVFASISGAIELRSSAFEDGGAISPRFTADGEGLFPPLSWSDPPATAKALALLVEDPDAPSPKPLVHLVAWDLPPGLRALPEGAFASPGHQELDEVLGKNSYLQAKWLPPDPPTGHGAHRYVFQLYALTERLGLEGHPGRSQVLAAMEGRVAAKGLVVGTYERP
jgi:Raf kinase inhibitor-like YbhB/YbcL family protein